MYSNFYRCVAANSNKSSHKIEPPKVPTAQPNRLLSPTNQILEQRPSERRTIQSAYGALHVQMAGEREIGADVKVKLNEADATARLLAQRGGVTTLLQLPWPSRTRERRGRNRAICLLRATSICQAQLRARAADSRQRRPGGTPCSTPPSCLAPLFELNIWPRSNRKPQRTNSAHSLSSHSTLFCLFFFTCDSQSA